MEKVLVVAGLVVFIGAIYSPPRALARFASKLLCRGSRAAALTEIYTVLDFTVPAAPATIQRAVDAKLGLPHEAPTLVARMHISDSRFDHLRVALGSTSGTEWSGVATFRPDNAGGTTGNYQVSAWTVRDGDLHAGKRLAEMRQIRDRISAVVVAHGGESSTRLVPASDRTASDRTAPGRTAPGRPSTRHRDVRAG